MMEPTAYNITLVIGIMVNGFAGLLLMLQSFYEGDHPPYRRALGLTALALWIFAIGFWCHLEYHWRTTNPALASALTLTYFHICGMLFSWNHTGLADPFYPTWKICLRDLTLVAIAVPCYWMTDQPVLRHAAYVVCALHCTWLAITFYRHYYCMRRGQRKVTTDPRIRLRVRFMAVFCHLIVAFGIGGIIVTALTPHVEWPFTLLLGAATLVFSYIAGSLSFYNEVAERVGNAIEDAALVRRSPGYARYMQRVMSYQRDYKIVN